MTQSLGDFQLQWPANVDPTLRHALNLHTQFSRRLSWRPTANAVLAPYSTLIDANVPTITTSNCTVTADTTIGLFGGYNYKIAVTGTNAYVEFGSGYPFPVAKGSQWLISAYIQCSAASQSIKLGIKTATSTYNDSVTTNATSGTTDRLPVKVDLRDDTNGQATFRLDIPSSNGDTFYMDGVMMEPGVAGSVVPSPFLSPAPIIGRSGDAVPILNQANTWADLQTFSSGVNVGGSDWTAYDEASFTPTLTFDTPGTSSVSYLQQFGLSTVDGRKCHIYLKLKCTPTIGTASGHIQIAGLPKTPYNVSGYAQGTAGVGGGEALSLGSSYSYMTLNIFPGLSYGYVLPWGSSGAGGALTTSALTSGSEVLLIFEGDYIYN